MIEYKHLEGRPWKHGENDCYSAVQAFYLHNFGLVLRDYARPDNWWDHGLNLYMDNFHKEGFEVVSEDRLQDLLVGDLLLMQIKAPVADHAAVYLGNGWIFHHFFGRLSNSEQLRPLWWNTRVATIRHPLVKLPDDTPTFNLADDPRVRAKLDRWKNS